MSVSMQIVTHSPSLDMYGEPDTSSAYSLSGYVSISLNAASSIFERHITTSYLLQSLHLTFEGHTELLLPHTGYTSLRLCTISKDIAPADSVELSNEGQEDTDCQWNIIFNIPVPGWLPASTRYGTHNLGIKYNLDVVAVLVPLDDPSTSTTWSLSSLCTPFRSRTNKFYAGREIKLRRYIDTEPLGSTEVPDAVYLVNSRLMTSSDEGSHIPQSILSRIQVLASVPEYIDVHSNQVALTIRLRTKDLEDEQCRRLQLTGFSLDIIQREKSRYQPSEECLRRFPIPRASEQPPNKALRHPYRGGFFYDDICTAPNNPNKNAGHQCDVSLLHDNECGEYRLEGDCHIFAKDACSENPSWYTLQTLIPVVSRPKHKCKDEVDWIGAPKLRATSYSPLLSFRHEVRMSLSCSYDLPDGQTANDVLSFSVPLKFSNVPPPPPVSSPAVPLVVRSHVMNPPPQPTEPSSMAYTQTSALPAYSQLFYSNGDRKLDSTPLPLYTSRDAPSSTESTSTAPNPSDDELLEAVSNGKIEETLTYMDDHDNSLETTSLLS